MTTQSVVLGIHVSGVYNNFPYNVENADQATESLRKKNSRPNDLVWVLHQKRAKYTKHKDPVLTTHEGSQRTGLTYLMHNRSDHF